jgi:sec-independent protein translocase protein TatB
MFDIGWSELLVIAVVLIVVVGPKDLPPMIRAFGKTMAGLRKMAGDFRTQFDEALKEADMDDVRQTISDVRNLNPTNSLRDAMNPLRQLGNEIKSDLQKATAAPDSLSSTPAPATSERRSLRLPLRKKSRNGRGRNRLRPSKPKRWPPSRNAPSAASLPKR